MIIVLLPVLFEKPDDLRPVGFDLPPKLFDRPEFPFAANKFQQVDRNGATVQIAVEPEHMRFEHPTKPLPTVGLRPRFTIAGHTFPSTVKCAAYTPLRAGTDSPTARLAVGKPSRRPSRFPADHFARNLKIHPEK